MLAAAIDRFSIQTLIAHYVCAEIPLGGYAASMIAYACQSNYHCLVQ